MEKNQTGTPASDVKSEVEIKKGRLVKWIIASLIVTVILVVTIALLAYSSQKNKVHQTEITPIAENKTEINQEDMPAAPDGFEWTQCKNIESWFLRPNGWHTKEEENSSTKACFITKEKLVPGGRFKTGLTVNKISGVLAKTGKKPSEYADSFIKALENEVEKADTINTLDSDVFAGSWRYSENKNIKAYNAAAGNDADDSLYLIIFESPAGEWDTVWGNTGQIIIRKMALWVP